MERNKRKIVKFLLIIENRQKLNSFFEPPHLQIISPVILFIFVISSKCPGAKNHFDLLTKSGANSIRVWSTNNKELLDSAHHYGLTVTLGLHVRPERSGMDYNNEIAKNKLPVHVIGLNPATDNRPGG